MIKYHFVHTDQQGRH